VNRPPPLSSGRRRTVLDLALGAIAHALLTGRRRVPGPSTLPEWLRDPAASFVTLRRDGRLLGCIGSLEAHQALGCDVAEHALDAAFDDPRLPPIDGDDFDRLALEVSVLSALEPLPDSVHTRAALLSALRPGVDGLVVASGPRRATFLPAVWRSVAGADDFVALLWRKAGLPPGTWPRDLRLATYQVVECEDPGPRDLADWTT
jgi:AmmeMemoRadiSam system protein A